MNIFIIFHLVSHSRTDPVPQPISPMRRPSRTTTLPLSFYMIPFKLNLFFKENNSKIFSETLFFTKLFLTFYFIIFDRVFGTKIIVLFIP
jgi:hypothetical protein